MIASAVFFCIFSFAVCLSVWIGLRQVFGIPKIFCFDLLHWAHITSFLCTWVK
jgi:hypothetical protein